MKILNIYIMITHEYKISDNCIISFNIYEGNVLEDIFSNKNTSSYIIINCDNVKSLISLDWFPKYNKKLDSFMNTGIFNIDTNSCSHRLLIKNGILQVLQKFNRNSLTIEYNLVNQNKIIKIF